MTWGEIKKAVEKADIKDTDDIYRIECERQDGDKILHKSASGKMFDLLVASLIVPMYPVKDSKRINKCQLINTFARQHRDG